MLIKISKALTNIVNPSIKTTIALNNNGNPTAGEHFLNRLKQQQ